MRIRIDDSDVQAGYRRMVDQQMPFIIAETINGLMLDAQKEVVRGIHARFKVREAGLIRRTVKIRKFAKKRDLSTDFALDGKGADILAKFEEGGTKRPVEGANLAIPQDVKANRAGLIIHRNRPRALIDARKAFLIRTPRGGVILERYGRKTSKKRRRTDGGSGRKTRILYLLRPRVKIDDRLEFIDTVTKTFTIRFDRQFDLAFTRAMRTAR